MAAEVQNLFPIKPAFVSFSTTDHDYARLYFAREPSQQAYRSHYVQAGLKYDSIQNAVGDGLKNPNASGIPPINFSQSKMKYPALTIPLFNNPELIHSNPANASEIVAKIKERGAKKKFAIFEGISQLTGAGKRSNTTKKIPEGKEAVTETPPFYNPSQTNIPLHPFTPLFDISQIKDLSCHVSYSQDQIDKNSQLAAFVAQHPQSWVTMYPSLTEGKSATQQFKTMKFQVTPNGLMLEQNTEDKAAVSSNLLLGIVAFMTVFKIGTELYEAYLVNQAQQQGFDVDGSQIRKVSPILVGSESNLHHELSELQRTRQRLIGQSKMYDISVAEPTTFKERWAAWTDHAAIGFRDVINPWFSFPQSYLDLKSGALAETNAKLGLVPQEGGAAETTSAPQEPVGQAPDSVPVKH